MLSVKKYLSVVLLFLTVLATVLCGCSYNKEASPKEFTSDGLTVTLTDKFVKTDITGYTLAYDSTDVAMWALKEEFYLVSGVEKKSVEEYAQMVIDANGGKYETQTKDGLIWFEYDFTNKSSNKEYHYWTYLFKANDAFWTVQFASLKSEKDMYAQQIEEWAKTVSFN